MDLGGRGLCTDWRGARDGDAGRLVEGITQGHPDFTKLFESRSNRSGPVIPGFQRRDLDGFNIIETFAFVEEAKVPTRSGRAMQIVGFDPRVFDGNRPFGNAAQLLEDALRSEEHTSELQSLMRISYAVFCLTKKIITNTQ